MMLEVKPLTTADHFVHATHPIAVTRAVTPHVAATSVLVTISPQAAALATSRQKETAKAVNAKQKRSNPYQEAAASEDLISEEAQDTKKALSDAEGS
jgi:hypothetical protein